MSRSFHVAWVLVVGVFAVPVWADVFNMGAGLTSLETVRVGNAGNVADSRYGDYGSVAYDYRIGKYEVTAGQYCAFLNAVAKTDTYGLYSTEMWTYMYGCKIQRSGTSGNYSYSVALDYANRPVNFVSWGDSARFCNWMQNGQPMGAQDLSTTEDGAYCLNGMDGPDLYSVQRKPNARWAIPTEDEWYKAAYYKGGSANAGYWNYPTSSDTEPGQDLADVTGNNANYYTAPYIWPIDSGKYFTTVGEFQNSESSYGTFDQGGNVWELVSTMFHQSGTGIRGGAFDNWSPQLFASSYDQCSPWVEGYHYGFRVVEVPEPTTIVILAFGGVAVMRRRSLK